MRTEDFITGFMTKCSEAGLAYPQACELLKAALAGEYQLPSEKGLLPQQQQIGAMLGVTPEMGQMMPPASPGLGESTLVDMLSKMNPNGFTGNMGLLGARALRPPSSVTGGVSRNPVGISG